MWDFITNSKNLPIVLGAALFLVVLIIWVIYQIARRRRIKKTGIEEIGGIRYSAEDAITDGTDVNVTLQKGDILLGRDVTEKAGIKNKLKPGKYTVLSTQEGMENINMRVGAYVREFKHGSQLIVAEGEEVTPVSCAVILR